MGQNFCFMTSISFCQLVKNQQEKKHRVTQNTKQVLQIKDVKQWKKNHKMTVPKMCKIQKLILFQEK